MSRYYILDGKVPVPVTDFMEWALQFENSDRHVGQTIVGPYTVSTVFLGIDHSFGPDGPPILFETMVYRRIKGDETGRKTKWMRYEERYSTWDEAVAGHAKAVKTYTKQAKRLKS